MTKKCAHSISNVLKSETYNTYSLSHEPLKRKIYVYLLFNYFFNNKTHIQYNVKVLMDPTKVNSIAHYTNASATHNHIKVWGKKKSLGSDCPTIAISKIHEEILENNPIINMFIQNRKLKPIRWH